MQYAYISVRLLDSLRTIDRQDLVVHFPIEKPLSYEILLSVVRRDHSDAVLCKLHYRNIAISLIPLLTLFELLERVFDKLIDDI